MQKKVLYVLRRLLPFLGGAILLGGCVRDDRSDCLFPLRLHFSYNYNREQQDLFAAEIGQVRLYLFDARSGELKASAVTQVSDLAQDNIYTWQVVPGTYRVVAWGLSCTSDTDRYVADAGSGFGSGRMNVVTKEDGLSVEHAPEHLWWQQCSEVIVTGDMQQPYMMDLRKYTNDVRIEVSDVPEGFMSRLKCTISATNGAYDMSGCECGETPVIWFPEQKFEQELAINDFTTLRLSDGDDSWLHIEIEPDPAVRSSWSDGGVIYDGSLSGLLKKNPDLDLDLDDEFSLRIESDLDIGGAAGIVIWVNDWKVIELDVPLG